MKKSALISVLIAFLAIPLYSFNITANPSTAAISKKIVAERQTGTVKWFNAFKGYGFIVPDDGTSDVFVHYSNIDMPGFRFLIEGQRVSYDLVMGPKGPQAANVRVILLPLPPLLPLLPLL